MSWYDLEILNSWLDTLVTLTWSTATWAVTSFIQNTISDPSQALSMGFVIWIIVGIMIFGRCIAIIWTAKDSSARVRSFSGQIISILWVALFTPLVWLPLYLALRPAKYKNTGTYRQEALDLQVIVCGKCDSPNLSDHKYCIYCGESLVVKCKWCTKSFSHEFVHCPYCWEKK